jgi:hypothetical protein
LIQGRLGGKRGELREKKKKKKARFWWATQEAEIRRIAVRSQPSASSF